jgi:hypothetical protein
MSFSNILGFMYNFQKELQLDLYFSIICNAAGFSSKLDQSILSILFSSKCIAAGLKDNISHLILSGFFFQ